MKVAIVHDWLITYAGSERVVEQMLRVFPEADLFSLVDFLPAHERGFIGDRRVTTSFIQRLPFAKGRYPHYLPFMPFAVEQFDLSVYDLVLSSSHAVAKGVLTSPDQLHLCLCHSPIRYAWDLQHQYLKESGLDKGLKSVLARWLLHRIRLWDYRTANGVDGFVAISKFIAGRIWKVYRREATVIYPPVDVHQFTPGARKEDFYLAASRMAPYKKIDLIVETFSRHLPDKKLIVIGDGPEMRKIRGKAGKNVDILGFQPFEVLKDHMQRAAAFVFAAEEDFGIMPLEAQACGTPVIAFGKGGARETIRGLETSKPTGVFFSEQTCFSLVEAVGTFIEQRPHITPENCRENALRFAPERFREEFSLYVQEQWRQFRQSPLNQRSIN